MKRFLRPAFFVVAAALTMLVFLAWAMVGIVKDFEAARVSTQQTLDELKMLTADSRAEIDEHRARDLRHLCNSELHEHASLEAVISIAEQAGLEADGFHVDVDRKVAKACEKSSRVPSFTKELERIHRQAGTTG